MVSYLEGKDNPNWQGGRYEPCTQCGKEVWCLPSRLKKAKNIFCSTKCHDDYRRKPKTTLKRDEIHGKNHWRWTGAKCCKGCGAKLTTSAERKRGYCSDDCARKEWLAARKRAMHGENHPNWKGGSVIKVCESCGTSFEVSHHKKDTAHYCSCACADQGRRRRVDCVCEHCGKAFEVPESRVRMTEKKGYQVRFCSVRCKQAFRGRSSLEVGMREALTKANVEFEEQYQPNGQGTIYDFYLPRLDLLIETDGDFYHHSQWARDHGIVARDRKKTKRAKGLGLRLLRVRGKDLRHLGAEEIVRTRIWPIRMHCVAMSQLG